MKKTYVNKINLEKSARRPVHRSGTRRQVPNRKQRPKVERKDTVRIEERRDIDGGEADSRADSVQLPTPDDQGPPQLRLYPGYEKHQSEDFITDAIFFAFQFSFVVVILLLFIHLVKR